MTESWTWVLMSFRVLVVAAPALAAPAASYGDGRSKPVPTNFGAMSSPHGRAKPLTASHSGNLAFISESDTEIIVTSPLSRAKQVGIKITYSRDNT
jgi:hypothetical protein